MIAFVRDCTTFTNQEIRFFHIQCGRSSLETLSKLRSFDLFESHLSTAVAWREKKFKHFVFYKCFSLILGLLKSRISKKSLELLLRKSDFNLFHYKVRVQPVSKLTPIAARNRC